METNAEPDQIQVTEKVFLLLKDDFEFESSGVRTIKGKGKMNTYLVTGKKAPTYYSIDMLDDENF